MKVKVRDGVNIRTENEQRANWNYLTDPLGHIFLVILSSLMKFNTLENGKGKASLTSQQTNTMNTELKYKIKMAENIKMISFNAK